MAFDGASVRLRTVRKTVVCLTAGLLLTAFSAVPSEGRNRQPPVDSSSVGMVAQGDLPVEAQATMQRVRSGGPFPYGKDGVVFGNRERHLPGHPRGFYKEYTVVTPGSRDRGARRIVCGGPMPTAPEACYYTGDHYNSFKRIVD